MNEELNIDNPWNLSAKALSCFLDSGWHPHREIAIDEWIKYQKKYGLSPGPKVSSFMKNCGGLNITPPALEDGTYNPRVLNLCLNEMSLPVSKFGVQSLFDSPPDGICFVGRWAEDLYEVFMDESECVWVYYDEIERAGTSFAEAMNTLLFGDGELMSCDPK